MIGSISRFRLSCAILCFMIHLATSFPTSHFKIYHNHAATQNRHHRTNQQSTKQLSLNAVTQSQPSFLDTTEKILEQEALSRAKFCNYLQSLHAIRDKRERVLKMDAELAIMEERWKLSISTNRQYTGWYLKDDDNSNVRSYTGLAFEPDASCYAIVATAYAKAGMGSEGARRAERLVDRLSSYPGTQKQVHQKVLLSAIMKAWAMADNWTKANEWLDQMTIKGSAPDMMTYTMFLDALAQSQSANVEQIQHETREILGRMTKYQNWEGLRLSTQRLLTPAKSITMAHLAIYPAIFVCGALAYSLCSACVAVFANQGKMYKELLSKGMTSKVTSTAALSVATLAVALAGILLLGRTASTASTPSDSKQQESKEPTDTVASEVTKRRVTIDDEASIQTDGLLVKPIGVVRSIYRLCVGTPRQGLLAPNAHGRIELNGLTAHAVDGLENFSHIWIVFIFHLNTQAKNSNRIPTKIAPPALGGKKVGVFATRSPHRNNPIGMTLCKLDSITKPTKNNNKTFLNVSGLDLVDGTPVLDIKPYVPHYDSVPEDQLRLPSWVSEGLATRRPVNIEAEALHALENILTENPSALQFYGGDGQSIDAIMEQVTNCIAEVLSIDVRSAWQTKKAREGKFQAERVGRVQGEYDDKDSGDETNECTQQLDNLMIHYTVSRPDSQNRDASEGSGAEDIVSVHSIQLRDFSTRKSTGLDIDTTTDDATELLSSNSDLDSTIDEATDMTENEALTSESKAIVEALQSLAETAPTPQEGQEVQPPTILSPQLLKKTPERSRQKVDSANKDVIPTDGEYNALKNYWSKAASKNTPTGLIPEKEVPRSAKKYFAFSDKPMAIKFEEISSLEGVTEADLTKPDETSQNSVPET